MEATTKEQLIHLFQKNTVCFVSISDLPCKLATIKMIPLGSSPSLLPLSSSTLAFSLVSPVVQL